MMRTLVKVKICLTSIVLFALPILCETHILGDQVKPHSEAFGDAKYSSEDISCSAIDEINILVSETFSSRVDDRAAPNSKDTFAKSNFSTFRLILNFLQMFGVETNKIQALTVNGMVYLTQMAWKYLAPNVLEGIFERTKPELVRDGSPIDWISLDQKSHIQTLSQLTYDKNILDYLHNILPKDESKAACIKLLLCKLSLFVIQMQHSMSNRTSVSSETNDEKNGRDKIAELFYVSENYKQHDKICELRHMNCMLMK